MDGKRRFDFGAGELERLAEEAREFKGESLWQDAWRRLRRNRFSWWAGVFLAIFMLGSFLAPVFPLRSPTEIRTGRANLAPSFGGGDLNYLSEFKEDPTNDELDRAYWDLSFIDHGLLRMRMAIFKRWQPDTILGTDNLGRDILSRIVWGSRTSILVALAATLFSLLIGVTYGAFSGLMGGRIDNLMMRIVDILYSIPFIFVVIFLITFIGDRSTELEDKGIDREFVFYVVIGAVYWLTMARVVRGQVLSLKNSEFIEALRVMGASTPRILFAHVVPNILSIVIVYLTLTIPAIMLFEAFLSFLGLGIEAPKVSWGTLANDGTSAINPLRIYWWLVAFPAAAMGSTLLALNILGDGLRDALDPKMRGKD